MRILSRKQVAAQSCLWVRVPRLPLCERRVGEELNRRSRGLAAKAARLQRDERWFESTRDHSFETHGLQALLRQSEERLDLKSGECGFESHAGHGEAAKERLIYGSVGNGKTTLA